MESGGAGAGGQLQGGKADPGVIDRVFSGEADGSSSSPAHPPWSVAPSGQAKAWLPQTVFRGTPGASPATQPMASVPFVQASIVPALHLDWTSAVYFPLFLLLVWLVILFTASHAGWHRFAKVFRANGPIPGRRFRATSARFGSINGSYVDVVYVTFGAEGLYVSATLPFRMFHRPFLIPWSSVTSIKRGERHFKPRYRICVEDPHAGKLLLRLPGSIDADLKRTRPDGVRLERRTTLNWGDALRT